ncbi:DUF1146 family protein [Fictibacillus nanhaiensis]|uniref:DUF1146 family protein n=1 Tax=Fictibacillus nanhaiensis TaxID=742169 RepID=UPI003C23FE56
MIPIGQQALLHIIVHLLFLVISWWALQAVHFDKWIKKGKVMQARVLYILLVISLASIASDFFLKYLQYSKNLGQLFG